MVISNSNTASHTCHYFQTALVRHQILGQTSPNSLIPTILQLSNMELPSTTTITIAPSSPHTHTIIFLHGRGDTAPSFASSIDHSLSSNNLTLPQTLPPLSGGSSLNPRSDDALPSAASKSRSGSTSGTWRTSRRGKTCKLRV